MKYLQILFFISTYYTSCKSKETEKVNNAQINSAYIHSDTISKQEAKYDEEVKPIEYHFLFDSSKSVLGNLNEGWVDSFSIDRQKFRLRFDTSATVTGYEYYCMEQCKNKKWYKVFNIFLNQDDYSIFDINNDGYFDFVKFYHARHYVYRYDPIKKIFSSDCFIMPEDVNVLDGKRYILYDYYEIMYGNTYESSSLYTYKNGIPYPLYQLHKKGENVGRLYAYKNGKWEDSSFVMNIYFDKSKGFDYKGYWKANYKLLLDIR